ncbi:MAG: hypothetical protein HY916_01825 [Desulfovibrio sp.]|jgi:CO/xanthine dehydrogenase FAD-binding subunit|nr:hypothetical protein [Desulfovibrio sp.]
MNTDRASLAFARVCFFVMLFLSTACNRMDAGRLEAASLATPAVAAQPVAAQPIAAQLERTRVPEERLADLEAQLRAEAARIQMWDRNAIRYD